MARPAPDQIVALVDVLHRVALSESHDERESEESIYRTGHGVAPWWQLTVNHLAPVVVEARTKRVQSTVEAAYADAVALRDAILASHTWGIRDPAVLATYSAANAGDDSSSDVDMWFGYVRLRLAPTR